MHAETQESGLAVRVTELVKRHGDTPVLDGLTLTVPVGQKLGIIGPSGSGKSTLLRVIMGLEAPSQGEMELLGSRDLARARRELGMVFQHFHLFPHMSVLRNVAEAPRRVAGLSRAEAEARAVNLLERVGLADKLAQFPRSLSGGQQQRVAIARALAMNPKILLLDEITSALDPELVSEVVAVMRDLSAMRDMTLLIVTHELAILPELADRVVFLEHGKVQDDGTPEEVIIQPRSSRTASFVGRAL